MIVILSVGIVLVVARQFFASQTNNDSNAWDYIPQIDTDQLEVSTINANYSDADYNYSGDDNVFTPATPNFDVNMQTNQPRDVNHPLAKLIRAHESGGVYNIVYGGKRFSNYDYHPFSPNGEFTRTGVRPATITTGINKGKVSTAAGRYQILGWVWEPIRRRLNLPDFSPESQDIAMLELIPKLAWQKYERGDVGGAILLLGPVWTSLPGSPTGESRLSLAKAVAEVSSYA